MLQLFKNLKLYIHKTSSRNCALSIPIKIYFQSSLSPSSNKVFFGSSGAILSQNATGYNDMSDLFCF